MNIHESLSAALSNPMFLSLAQEWESARAQAKALGIEDRFDAVVEYEAERSKQTRHPTLSFPEMLRIAQRMTT